MTIAFAGILPASALFAAIVTQWLFKVAYEVAATPLTYVMVNFLKRREGVDVFDHHTSFNPLAVTES